MNPFEQVRRLRRARPPEQTVARDVDDELRFHLESRIEELVGSGLDSAAARERAAREFGNVEAARSELTALNRRTAARRARTRRLNDLWLDVRFALRTWRRRPAMAVALLAILALGIGANSAIFTVVNAALLAPLPYRDAHQLVHLWETHQNGAEVSEASYPDFVDWRAQGGGTFDGLEGYDPTNVTVAGAGGARMTAGARVSAGFFDLLGVAPLLGRTFRAGEDVPGGTDIAILSHRYWRTELGGDPGALDRTIVVDGRTRRIVGVLPPGFHFAPAGDALLWFPLDRTAQTRDQRFNHWLNVVGRLRPGVRPDAARTAVGVIMDRLAATYPETNSGRGIRVVPLRDEVTGDVRPILLVLAVAVGLLLLIACANVAGILIAQALGRARELAVRTAIGATRLRLVRQLLTESLAISTAGAAVGLALAYGGVRLLVAAIPAGMMDGMPFLADLRPDPWSLVFTAGLATLAGLAFGTIPALIASSAAGIGAARLSARFTLSRPGVRLRDALVVGEVALTVVLLIGAGLVGRSLLTLLREDPGFRAERVLTARVPLAGAAYGNAQAQRRFFEELLGSVRALPGVLDAGAVTNVPLVGGGTNTFRVEGEPEPPAATRPEAVMRGVAGGYFGAMGIPLLAGRAFGPGDDSAAAPVIVISQATARRHVPGGQAVGRRLRFYAFPTATWEVVGVVGDVKTGRLDTPAPPTIYYSHLQAPQNRMTLVLRTAGDPASLRAAVRAAVRTLDPELPVYQLQSMEQVVADSPAVFARRFPLVLMGFFAAVALLLAGLGVYGVVAFGVAQRRHELGIRAALGATPRRLMRLVIRHGALLAAVGGVGGVLLAVPAARLVAGMLYGVPITDALTYTVVLATVGGAVLLATAIPARRAAGSDPATALRAE